MIFFLQFILFHRFFRSNIYRIVFLEISEVREFAEIPLQTFQLAGVHWFEFSEFRAFYAFSYIYFFSVNYGFKRIGKLKFQTVSGSLGERLNI